MPKQMINPIKMIFNKYFTNRSDLVKKLFQAQGCSDRKYKLFHANNHPDTLAFGRWVCDLPRLIIPLVYKLLKENIGKK